jgi:hypothetical protein
MGIAAMVIGIVSAVLGFIPFCNYFALIPAGVGFILGIVDVAIKSNKNQNLNEGESKQNIGQGVAGIVLNSLAIIVIVLWTFIFVAASAA